MSKDFSIENRIRANRIMPIAVVSSSEDGPRLAEALLAGGIDLLEITLRTEAARSALRETRRRFPDILLGAGTILDAEIIPELVEDGIDFLSDEADFACVDDLMGKGPDMTVVDPGQIADGDEVCCCDSRCCEEPCLCPAPFKDCFC